MLRMHINYTDFHMNNARRAPPSTRVSAISLRDPAPVKSVGLVEDEDGGYAPPLELVGWYTTVALLDPYPPDGTDAAPVGYPANVVVLGVGWIVTV